MPVIQPQDLFRTQFAPGERQPFPLPPPGRPYDGRASEPGSALFAADAQVSTVTLGGTTIAGDKTTLTITPKLLQSGSAWSQQMVPIVVTFVSTDGLLATVAAGLDAALVAAQTVSTPEDIANYQRVREVVLHKVVAGALEFTAKDAGLTFGVEIVSKLANDDPGTVTSVITVENATPDKLSIGTVGFSGGRLGVRGEQLIVNASASSTSEDILGVVLDGMHKAPEAAGYLLAHYTDGQDVPYQRYGTCTAYAEEPVSADGLVYVRRIAAANQVLNAVAGSPVISAPEIVTVTPTAVNTTVYSATLNITDLLTGEVVASGWITYTSDGDALASEIVTGLTASLAGPQAAAVAAYITPSGTDTLVLEQADGFSLDVVNSGAGTLAPVVTQAAVVEHVLYSGATFLQSTTAAGSAPINVPHP